MTYLLMVPTFFLLFEPIEWVSGALCFPPPPPQPPQLCSPQLAITLTLMEKKEALIPIISVNFASLIHL